MKALLLAIELTRKYNKMSLEDCIKEFEEYTGQKIPKKAIEDYKFTGLNNIDMFTSDYLNKYGLKNLLQL